MGWRVPAHIEFEEVFRVSIDEKKMSLYTKFLHEELLPAMGCTEPIAIAYGAAYARKVLGKDAERYEVECSGNIIKT